MDEGSVKVRFLIGRFLILMILGFIALAAILLWVVQIDEKVFGEGHIVARDDVEIRAFADGVIATMQTYDGMEVEAGQVLATLDDTRVRRELERQRERLHKAESELEVAVQRRRKLETDPLPDRFRYTEIEREQAVLRLRMAESEYQAALALEKDGIVSAHELSRLRTQFEIAQKNLEVAENMAEMVQAGMGDTIVEEARKVEEVARREMESARAECRRLEEELARHVIRTPETGRVIWSRLKVGEAVRAGDRMFIVQISDRLELRVFVSDAGVAQISPGLQAIIYSQAYSYSRYGLAYGETLTVSSSPDVVDGKATYLVRISVDESPRPLPIGSRARARIVIRKRPILYMLFGIGE